MRRWAAWTLLAVLAGFFGVCVGPTPLRDRLYREVSYQFVADRVTAGAATDAERTVRLFEFVHLHVNVVGAPVIDDTPWNDLVRGIGWCDQQSWGLATLLSKEGIHARFAMLRNAAGVSPHTVAEVKIGDRWAFFDPLHGLYYQKPDGAFATLEEISQEPALMAAQPRIQLLKPEVRDAFLRDAPKLYAFEQKPTRWSSLLVKKNRSPGQRIVNQAIRVAVRGLGARFAYAYQDLYYLTERGSRDPEALFRRARNYHLYGRHAAAERAYRRFLERFPQHERAEDAQFYLAVALSDTGRHADSLSQLDELQRQVPANKWSALIPYYAGRNYEAMGEIARAVASYEQVAASLDLDGPWRLADLLRHGGDTAALPRHP